MPAGSTLNLQGPFSENQLSRISGALDAADRETGMTFSVYVGQLEGSTREHAERLHAQLERPDGSVLIAISPNQRMLEIVTGSSVRDRLSDQSCGLVAMSMTSSLSGGDLAGAIVVGLHMLSERARW
ncbi:MAG TPA: DUF5130 family protein [Mycobacteriales bacterium]|nr:DUF5130 family protein [Mycobacteriales bacterium]